MRRKGQLMPLSLVQYTLSRGSYTHGRLPDLVVTKVKGRFEAGDWVFGAIH